MNMNDNERPSSATAAQADVGCNDWFGRFYFTKKRLLHAKKILRWRISRASMWLTLGLWDACPGTRTANK